MAAVRAQISTFEKFFSFGGVCSIIGVVGDLLTPVGNYTLYALVAGVGILSISLICVPLLTFRSSITQTLMMFGLLLTIVSGVFFASAQGTQNGLAAEKISWVADAQTELLGLQEAANQIAQSTENIARSSNAIARNTAMSHNLNYSDEGFRSARASLDEETIALYCARGYRADHLSEIFLDSKSGNREPARRFAILNGHGCVDTKLCNPAEWKEMWHDLSDRLDEKKVEAVCGSDGLQTLRDHRSKIELGKKQSEDAFQARKAKYEACLAQKSANPYVAQLCVEPRRAPI
jgi:hypothetical protein